MRKTWILCQATKKLNEHFFEHVNNAFHQSLATEQASIWKDNLPPKNQETYIRFLNNLSDAAEQQQLQLSTTVVCTDFETAIIYSIRNKFTSAQIWGCLFHNAQSVSSKVENIGLKQPCKESKAIKRLVRRCCGWSVDEV